MRDIYNSSRDCIRCLRHHVGTLRYVWFGTAAAAVRFVGVDCMAVAAGTNYTWVADLYDSVLILQTYLLKLVKVVLSKLTIILSQELDFPLMLEFMHRYCRYMTTFETTKIGVGFDLDVRRCKN
jgi:hypothetical protein